MRDLTEEELALAPEWATHYIVDSDDSIIYENASFCWWCGLDNPIDNTVGFGKMKNRPITGREFDITQHEWSDCDIQCEIETGYVRFKSQSECDEFVIEKDDVIALANHFNIRAEDLK